MVATFLPFTVSFKLPVKTGHQQSDGAPYGSEADPGGLSPPPRTAQLIVKFGEKVLQIDYKCCK